MDFKKTLVALLAAACLLPCGAQKKEGLGHLKADSPSPEWLESAVIYEANLRQGTPMRNLRGLQLELPRLKDLGIDVVWLMPIHPISEKERKGTLGSYYAVRDYKGVNPEFGTLDDLKEFVRTAHNLGMKVILDEVCNHTGADHNWVTEHPEYYARNEKGEMFGPYDWTDVYKLDYSNPGTRAAMLEALKFWVSEADIDGYRCDVAGEVPTDFWEEARTHLQDIKPVLMLAESDKPELLLKAFDIDYAWPMKDVFNAIALTQGVNSWGAAHKEKRPETHASDIRKLIEKQGRQYPAGAIHMNMITNHDLNSWEGTEFDRFGPATGAFAVLSHTLPGAPMMYTGQEVGFNHAFEFFERDSIMPTNVPNEFTAFYESLNALKHKNPALNAHAPIKFIETGNPDVIAFTRGGCGEKIKGASSCCGNSGNSVTVIANLSAHDTKLSLPEGSVNTDGATDWFSSAGAKLPASLKPWEYIVICK